MITKELFVNYINTLKEYNNKIDKFTNSISMAFDGYVVYELDSELIFMYVKMLKSLINDTDDWIDYYIFELEYGIKYKDGCVILENGDHVDISTPEKLYTALTTVL